MGATVQSIQTTKETGAIYRHEKAPKLVARVIMNFNARSTNIVLHWLQGNISSLHVIISHSIKYKQVRKEKTRKWKKMSPIPFALSCPLVIFT